MKIVSKNAFKKVLKSTLKLDDYTIGVDTERVIDLRRKTKNCKNKVKTKAP